MKEEENFNDYNLDEVIEKMFNQFFIVDNILKARKIDEDLFYSYIHQSKKESIASKLKEYDIISIDINNTMSLTKEGFKVVRLGGWKSYLQHLEQLETQAEADRQLAIEVNESVKSTNENQLKILKGTILISVVSLIISILTYFKNAENKVYLLPQQLLSLKDTNTLKEVESVFPKIKCRHNMDTFCCQDTPFFVIIEK